MTNSQKVKLRHKKAFCFVIGPNAFQIAVPSKDEDGCCFGISHIHETRKQAWKCAAKQIAMQDEIMANNIR